MRQALPIVVTTLAAAMLTAALAIFATGAAAQTAVTPARGDEARILVEDGGPFTTTQRFGPIYAQSYSSIVLMVDCAMTGTDPKFKLHVEIQDLVDVAIFKTIFHTDDRNCGTNFIYYMGGGVQATSVSEAGGTLFSYVTKGYLPVKFYVTMSYSGTSPSWTGDLIMYPIPGGR